MERLTMWDKNNDLLVKEEERILNANGVITHDEMYKIMRHLAEKLADYEDTGLTPTMVLDTIKARDMAQKQALENAHIVDDYRHAEEQGLLLRLPCKVGDTIYAIPSRVNFRLNKSLGYTAYNRVFPQIVDHIEFNSHGYWVSTCDGMQGHRQEAFGETWFLTREEAELALAEMQKG